MRFLGADEKYRWFHVRGLPVRDTNGRIVRWYALHIDIDDRKRAEETLRESERNFKLMIDTIPALVWSARPDGSAEFFSQHYLDYVGLSAEQAQGWGWAVTVHPDDLSRPRGFTWQASNPLRGVLGALCEMVEEAGPGCYCGVHPIDWSGPWPGFARATTT